MNKKFKRHQEPTALQRKAFKLAVENPNMPKSEVLRRAGYNEGAALQSTAVFNSAGIKNLQKEYNYYLDKEGVNTRLLAERMRDGLDGEDKKASVLEYVKEAKRDLGLSKETPDTMIQINITGDLQEYAK